MQKPDTNMELVKSRSRERGGTHPFRILLSPDRRRGGHITLETQTQI